MISGPTRWGALPQRARWALATLGSIAAAAVLLPMFAADASREIGDVMATRLMPPFTRDAKGTWHVLGTDAFGRDVLLRVWVGARVSLANSAHTATQSLLTGDIHIGIS